MRNDLESRRKCSNFVSGKIWNKVKRGNDCKISSFCLVGESICRASRCSFKGVFSSKSNILHEAEILVVF